jgi:hypothetical protein
MVRLLMERVWERGGPVESAFLLWGDPPAAGRAARVRDVRPLDSLSSCDRVAVDPRSLVKARRSLMEAHPGEGDGAIGIAHSHPGPEQPERSTCDQRWHRTVLDMHHRDDLVCRVPLVAGGGPVMPASVEGAERVPLQVFYSTIFPISGDLAMARTYLLARPLGGLACGDLEVEISHALSESLDAAAALAGLHPTIRSAGTEVAITYGDGP